MSSQVDLVGGALEVLAGGLARRQENISNRVAVQAKSATHKAQTAEAKLSKSRSEAQNTPENIANEERARQVQLTSIINTQAKTAMFDGLRLYGSTGKLKYLNQMFSDTPTARKLFRNVASIEKIDPEQDQALLNENGITPYQFNSFVHTKGVFPDGSTKLFNILELMGGTGYLNKITDEELDLLIKEKSLFGNPDSESGTPSALEKKARFATEQGLNQGDLRKNTELLFNSDIAGTSAGKVELGNKAIEDLTASFGGADAYFEADLQDRSNRLKAEPHIRALEQFSGLKLAPADRKDLKDINSLVSLGGLIADKLTPEVTGALDTVLRTAKNYISDSTDAVDATEAQSLYGAYRNTIRHALFGSALTETEVTAFNEAFGTLKQKYPAVITQFKSSLLQLRSKLSTIAETNNPYLAKYYMGKSAEEVDIIIGRLDERLEMLERAERNATNSGKVETAGGEIQSDRDPEEVRQEAITSILGARTQ